MNQKKNIPLLCIIVAIWTNYGAMTESILKFTDGHKFKFTFGSCNKFYQTDNSSIFDKISDYKPDLYAWIGDAAYIENMDLYYVKFSFPGPEIARQRLENTKNDPYYAKLRTQTPIIGVWDNHDYGQDGGGGSFPHKDIMQQIYLDFIDEPKESLRRTRKGIYEKYDVKIGNLEIRIILLDVRYHKNEETGDILGSEQWEWLEKSFQDKRDLYLIASGSQILPEDRILHDNWFPSSTKRLINMMMKYDIPAILLSGDVHSAEIMKLPCSESYLGYPLYELTSSGLTHTTRDHFPMGHVPHKLFFPETYNTFKDIYVDWNFGVIEIQHDSSNKLDSGIDLQIRDRDGLLVLQQQLKLRDLQRKHLPGYNTTQENLCFTKSREERFYQHLRKVLFDPEVMIFIGIPAFILLIPLLVLLGCIICIFCSSKSKSKIKSKLE